MEYSLIDCHCDTASKALDEDVGLYNNGLHVDLGKINNLQYTQFFAAFISPEFKKSAMKRALDIIGKLKREILKKDKEIAFCISYKDYVENKNKIRAFLSLEGGEAINSKEDLLKLYNEGVRMATLTWNYSNQLAGGVLEKEEGLTSLGKEIVREMNRLGIIVDVSHLNDKSFWDVIETSEKTVIASHSNSRTLCDNNRNLTDEQFNAIKSCGGVVGINLYSLFLTGDKNTGISDVINHIEHFMGLGGEDNIGIGADFDGMKYLPENISGIWDVQKIFDELLRLGYSENTVKKLSCTNMERILQEIL